MKKIKKLYHTHKKSLLALLIITIVYLVIVSLITKNKYLFASTTDYETQHYLLPEYFRNLFYDTKKLIPDFAMNLGGGQNIFYFSYYGLLSPIILLSYLFPKVAMIDYLAIAISVVVILSTFFTYLFLRKNKYRHSTSLLGALLFLCSAPLIYHAHRHIMFISYFPFLLLALFGVDQLLEKKKTTLLAISIGLMIMTSYYFSVAGIVVIIIYFVYKQSNLEKTNTPQEKVKAFLPIIKPIFLGLLLGMVIILPTAYCLLTGRGANTHPSLWNLFIPSPKFMYTAYSPGITVLQLLLLLAPLVVKKSKKSLKYLTVTLLIVFSVPICNYLLNGTLYLNAKSLIPFLPLVILIIAWSIEHISRHKKQLISVLLLMSFLICLFVNSTDTLIKKEAKNKIEEQTYHNLVTKLLQEDKTIYRIGNLTNSKSNLNKVYATKELKSSIYSSTQNKNYQKFYSEIAKTNQKYRNNMMVSTSDNILLQAQVGEKYLITEKQLQTGYRKIKKVNNLNLYKNNLALPLGYILKQKQKMTAYPDNLLSTWVFEKDIKKYKQKATISVLKQENISYQTSKKNIKIKAKDKAKLLVKIKEDITNQLVFISFKNKNNTSCQTHHKDQKIIINKIENKLTCKEWKYHNQNYTFHYVLTSPQELTIEITPGTYELEDIKIELFPLDKLTKENIIPLDITKIKDNYLEGSITSEEKNQLVLSFPYDKGYKIMVDGKETIYTKTNNNFIGIPITKGTHSIKLTYEAPYKKLGLLVTLLGLIIVLGDSMIKKYNKIVRK